jgi:hypothetical protein
MGKCKRLVFLIVLFALFINGIMQFHKRKLLLLWLITLTIFLIVCLCYFQCLQTGLPTSNSSQLMPWCLYTYTCINILNCSKTHFLFHICLIRKTPFLLLAELNERSILSFHISQVLNLIFNHIINL